MATQQLYFDQTASTQPLEEVLQLYLRLSREVYANPSALHRAGFEAEQVIRQAKKQLATSLGCLPEELLFTSCATESINTALRGYLKANPRCGKEIAYWSIEHKATLETVAALEEEGYKGVALPTTYEGGLDFEALPRLLGPDTALIAVSMVNNETGALLDLPRLLKLKQACTPQAKIHLDAVQAWMKYPLRLQASGVDFASFSGHKIHAPKGTGLLYHRKGLRFAPLLYGGGQQDGLRSGTENPVLAGALAEAVRLQQGDIQSRLQDVQSKKDFFLQQLRQEGLNFRLNSMLDSQQASPYILNLSIPGVRPETLLSALGVRGIFVASHSACSSKDPRSRVLQQMGVEEEYLSNSIRISLAAEHSKADLSLLAKALVEETNKLSRSRRPIGQTRRSSRED